MILVHDFETDLSRSGLVVVWAGTVEYEELADERNVQSLTLKSAKVYLEDVVLQEYREGDEHWDHLVRYSAPTEDDIDNLLKS